MYTDFDSFFFFSFFFFFIVLVVFHNIIEIKCFSEKVCDVEIKIFLFGLSFILFLSKLTYLITTDNKKNQVYFCLMTGRLNRSRC